MGDKLKEKPEWTNVLQIFGPSENTIPHLGVELHPGTKFRLWFPPVEMQVEEPSSPEGSRFSGKVPLGESGL